MKISWRKSVTRQEEHPAAGRSMRDIRARGNPELQERERERERPLNRERRYKKRRTEMKLATPSLPAEEAPLISPLYSGSRKPVEQS